MGKRHSTVKHTLILRTAPLIASLAALR
jgi:hypothetical protein